MSANMSSTNSGYQSAYSQYQQAMQDYKETASKNTGEAGYRKSVQMGSQGANTVAGGAQQQAQNAYRNAGMSKAQAANLGAGQGSQAYQQNFSNQQQQGANQLANEVTAKGNSANQASTAAQMQQQEGQNRYNRAWGNLGNTMGIVGSLVGAASDERLKESENVSMSPREYSEKMKVIFEKHNNGKRDYRALMCKGVK